MSFRSRKPFAPSRLSPRIRTSLPRMVGGMGAPEKTLEASDDGQNFREVAKLNGDEVRPSTPSPFRAVTAKYFRVVFKRHASSAYPRPGPRASIPIPSGCKLPPKPTDYRNCGDWCFTPAPRVNQFEEKAAFVPAMISTNLPTPPVAGNDAIAKSDVIDLTRR